MFSVKMAKYALLIILLLFLPTAGAVNYPQLKGFVTDNANMIDPVYEEKITQLAEKIEKENTVEIAVVTIDSLEGESTLDYAVGLFEQAGIGKKDNNNGLLILVAKKEREYRFEVGYGLEGTITDSMKVNIGSRIIEPNFKNGEYGKGIYDSMLVIEGLLRGNEEIVSQYRMPQAYSVQVSYDWIMVIFITLVILVIILSVFSEKGGWTYGGQYPRSHGGWEYGGGFGGGFGGYGMRRSGGGFGGGGFGGFGGGRSGGGGFGGKW